MENVHEDIPIRRTRPSSSLTHSLPTPHYDTHTHAHIYIILYPVLILCRERWISVWECNLLFYLVGWCIYVCHLVPMQQPMRSNESQNKCEQKCCYFRQRALPIHVVTLYLSLFGFLFISQLFAGWLASLFFLSCFAFLLLCSFVMEYVSHTIENRSIDRSMHFS